MQKLKTTIKNNADIFMTGICGIVYLVWFFILEQKVTDNYHIIHVGLDDYIPFVEYFIVPYLLWFVYVFAVWAFLLFKDREMFKKLSIFLFSGMFFSLFVCTIYPNGTDFRPVIDPEKNIFAFLVYKLYGIDTPTNVLPSIHVFNSIAVHIAILKSKCFEKKPVIKWGSLVLCISICLATVFLKQHSSVDVIAAGFLAYVVYGIVYEPVTESGTGRILKTRKADNL
ncbi:MAG: phosphatase PAP2 family protein [Eubacteriales bacterium]|nr:phosphatase PAP2 family protein [Eubacteriales bacterium]